MIKFVYKDYIKELMDKKIIKILTEEPLENVRGLSLDTDILINLSANQWKIIQEEQLIEEIEKTITHEHIHYLLKDVKANIGTEERICLMMAGQIIPTKIETFK